MWENRKNLIVGLLAAVMLLAGSGVASAKTVNEKILDIMLQRGTISAQEYKSLKKEAQAEAKAMKAADSGWSVKWSNGFKVANKEAGHSLKFGGRIMWDWATIFHDDEFEEAFGDNEGFGHEARRARLFMSGTVYKYIAFKAQYDFVGGDPEFKDVWLGLKKVPALGTVKVGHFKEPQGLEELTSSKYITFMERSLPIEAFVPGRNVGLAFGGDAMDGMLTYAAGIFEETDDFGDDFFNDVDDFNTTFRVTFAPIMEKTHVLHLGGSYSRKFRDGNDDNTSRFRVRPSVHITDRFVNTGRFATDAENIFGIEAAYVNGPFSIQGEFLGNSVALDEERTGLDESLFFWGAYGYVSYFLTGESRNYDGGDFGRVKPKSNFDWDGSGFGAWELAVRFAYLDLNDDEDDFEIRGGETWDITAGVNWYLAPNTRIMLNYVYANIEDNEAVDATDEDEVNLSAVQGRFQIDF
jgi:phosphate-selective porin OprO/OprP